jgi:hypothetical protein
MEGSMGTAKRYDARLVADVCGNKDVVMREAHDGLFVQHDDYAALEAALTAAEQRAKELEEALQGAKWELKRLEGAWWGGAITRPCQETIRIVDAALAQPRTAHYGEGLGWTCEFDGKHLADKECDCDPYDTAQPRTGSHDE